MSTTDDVLNYVKIECLTIHAGIVNKNTVLTNLYLLFSNTFKSSITFFPIGVFIYNISDSFKVEK